MIDPFASFGGSSGAGGNFTVFGAPQPAGVAGCAALPWSLRNPAVCGPTAAEPPAPATWTTPPPNAVPTQLPPLVVTGHTTAAPSPSGISSAATAGFTTATVWWLVGFAILALILFLDW